MSFAVNAVFVHHDDPEPTAERARNRHDETVESAHEIATKKVKLQKCARKFENQSQIEFKKALWLLRIRSKLGNIIQLPDGMIPISQAEMIERRA